MSVIRFPRTAVAVILVATALLRTCFFTLSSPSPAPLRVGAGQLASVSAVLQPQSPGTTTYSGNGATIDASNASEGYLTIKYKGVASKVKVRITRSGGTTYTYNLRTDGKYEVFPLTGGDGNYQVNVFTHVSGDMYAEALGKTISVKLNSPLLPFLYPSQYVNFSAKSKTVALGSELAKGAGNELEIVTNVYNHVVKNISYDTDKANRAMRGELTGYLPVVDTVIASGKGICFDYAAVMAAMLRSQQIPTRLEVGYVSGGTYHAWISTYIKDIGWVNGAIYFDGKNWKLMDPTFASNGSADIQSFIGNGDNYMRQYVY